MALEPVEILNSSLSLVCVIIFTIVGMLILARYVKYKNRTMLLIGFAWITMGSAWWPSSIGLLVYLFNGVGIPLPLYLVLGNLLLPIGNLAFLTALADLKYHNKRKLIITIFVVIGIIYEIYFLSYLIINPSELGILLTPVDIDFGLIMTLYLIFAILTVVASGVLIALESLKSKVKEIKLKGKFLLVAFISLLIGAAMDTLLEITFVTVPIIRIILILSAIEMYVGFFLPSWLKKRLVKN